MYSAHKILLAGIKPISLLGIVDNIYKGRQIRDEWLKEYPRLMEEMDLPWEQRGHMALIRDHLIDLQPFEKSRAASDSEIV
jgi:hypothetical protein